VNIVQQLERDCKALARAFLIVTDTPDSIQTYWKEREAARTLLAHWEECPEASRVVKQDQRDWLLFLFRQMVGEDVF
jgi:hypothetical protein